MILSILSDKLYWFYFSMHPTSILFLAHSYAKYFRYFFFSPSKDTSTKQESPTTQNISTKGLTLGKTKKYERRARQEVNWQPAPNVTCSFPRKCLMKHSECPQKMSKPEEFIDLES